MTKAASAAKMNSLHDRVASVFLAVLKRYESRLDTLDGLQQSDMDSMNEEFLTELFNDEALPNASMMAAITKFLKDNDVLFEKDKIEEISQTRRALEEKARNRPTLANLTVVPAIGVA